MEEQKKRSWSVCVLSLLQGDPLALWAVLCLIWSIAGLICVNGKLHSVF